MDQPRCSLVLQVSLYQITDCRSQMLAKHCAVSDTIHRHTISLGRWTYELCGDQLALQHFVLADNERNMFTDCPRSAASRLL
jgi:hypothetical protein